MIYKPPKKIRITTDPILTELRQKYSSRVAFQLFHHTKKKLFELAIIIWPKYPGESTEIYCPVTNKVILKPIESHTPSLKTFKSKNKQALLEKAYKYLLAKKVQPLQPPPTPQQPGHHQANQSNNPKQ